MITQIIEGQGWYFPSWIQLISWKSSKCWWWSRHNCQEISWRCNRSAMISSRKNDEAKGYWNDRYDTNSKSSLLFKAKWYDKEDRCNLSSSSKIVLRKEGPNSTVKKLHDNDIADKARNDLKDWNHKQRKLLKSYHTGTQNWFTYRCSWATNNSEPMKNWNQWEIIADEELIRCNTVLRYSRDTTG